MELPDRKKAGFLGFSWGFFLSWLAYDSLQNCCLSKQLARCGSQEVLLKLRVYLQNSQSPPAKSWNSQIFKQLWASVFCLFLFFLPRLAFCGTITAFQGSGWQDRCVVMGCVCVCNHGYFHLSDNFFSFTSLQSYFWGYIIWLHFVHFSTGAFEMEVFCDTEFSTISCLPDFVKRG